MEPRSPALQVDSLPAEPPGKPKNTGVGSLSLSRGSSQSRSRTGVSCTAGGFLTNWLSGKPWKKILYYILNITRGCEHAKLLQSCPTRCDPMNCSPPAVLCPWDSPGKNTGMDCHALLQGIFPTHGSNRPGSLVPLALASSSSLVLLGKALNITLCIK